MMQIKFNFNFIFYGVFATAWQRASGIYVVAGGCDWPLSPAGILGYDVIIILTCSSVTFLTLRALRYF